MARFTIAAALLAALLAGAAPQSTGGCLSCESCASCASSTVNGDGTKTVTISTL